MKERNMKNNTGMKVLILMLSFIMAFCMVPVKAATRKAVEVSTKKKLLAELNKSGTGTIVFRTSKAMKLSIPNRENAAQKTLIIDAGNASVSNSCNFASITLSSVKTYTENGYGNIIEVKAPGTRITVGKRCRVERISLLVKQTEITLKTGASVGSIISKKTASKHSVIAGKKSVASVSLAKKTNLTVSGSGSSGISIISSVKGNSIISSIPVYVSAKKNMTLKLNKGSEGSVIDLASKDISIKYEGSVKPEMTINGKKIEDEEPEKILDKDSKDTSNNAVQESGKNDTTGKTGNNEQAVQQVIIDYPSGDSDNNGGLSTVISVTSSGGYDYGGYNGSTDSDNSTVTGSGSSTDGSTGGAEENPVIGGQEAEDVQKSSGSENVGNNEDSQNTETGAVYEMADLESEKSPEGVFVSMNMSQNSYIIFGQPIKSYLYEENGFFYRVEKLYMINDIHIEKYDTDWNLVDSLVISFDSSFKWGGFFAGEKYNFFVLGQTNYEEDDDKMVFRFFRYDKEWNETGHADIYGCDTSAPFEGGTLRMAEREGILYALTCHTAYADLAGLRHQSSILLMVDESSLETSYIGFYDDDNIGLASHSFNQFIFVDSEGNLISLNQGDGNPRGIVVSVQKFDKNNRIMQGIHYSLQPFAPARDAADMFWLNKTGAMIGGITETEMGYVTAYTYDGVGGQLDPGNYVNSDVYISFLSKTEQAAPSRVSGTIIRYADDGTCGPKNPQVVPLDADGGYIFWEEYENADQYTTEYVVNYLRYYADGSVSGVRSFDGRLSECNPFLHNGKIYWYVTMGSVPMIYAFDISSETVEARYVCGSKKMILESRAAEKQMEEYYSHLNLLTDKVYDGTGRLVRIDYLDETGIKRASLEYEYNESGEITGGTYLSSGQEYGNECTFVVSEGTKGQYVSARREFLPESDNETNRYVERRYDEDGTVTSQVLGYHIPEIGAEVTELTEYTLFGLMEKRTFRNEGQDNLFTTTKVYEYYDNWNRKEYTDLEYKKNGSEEEIKEETVKLDDSGKLTYRFEKRTVTGSSDTETTYAIDDGVIIGYIQKNLLEHTETIREFEPGTFDGYEGKLLKETYTDAEDETYSYEAVYEYGESGYKVSKEYLYKSEAMEFAADGSLLYDFSEKYYDVERTKLETRRIADNSGEINTVVTYSCHENGNIRYEAETRSTECWDESKTRRYDQEGKLVSLTESFIGTDESGQNVHHMNETTYDDAGTSWRKETTIRENETEIGYYENDEIYGKSIYYQDGSYEDIDYTDGEPCNKTVVKPYEEDPERTVTYSYEYSEGEWVQVGDPILSE